ncbi:MAG: ABC transporter substrate-binding protein [Chitinophagaceae bacterium]|nr:ABC transporter substrate-binding protein [Chitinophagaceae bacterium]
MRSYQDQLQETIRLNDIPKRIVSLVPSQTELLFDLGLDETVVGITKFCIHPQHWFRNKTRVGGTKQVHIHRVAALQPDLILANKEENIKEQIHALRSIAPVWTSDIHDIGSALEMIAAIGEITARSKEAQIILQNIQDAFRNWSGQKPVSAATAAYLIWQEPYMTVGQDTFIHQLLLEAGFRNVFAQHKRYPEISMEALRRAAPDFLLLSSEPYPFQEKHIRYFQEQLPGTQVLLVDGEMFSWYGSRIQHSPAYFCRLWADIHRTSTTQKS